MAESRKSIFITGAASGLGREVGRYFASKGWFVGIADINEAGMAETAAMLPEGQSSVHLLDVTRPQAVEKGCCRFCQGIGRANGCVFQQCRNWHWRRDPRDDRRGYRQDNRHQFHCGNQRNAGLL